MRVATLALAAVCVVLGLVPGVLVGPLMRLEPWAGTAPSKLSLHLRGTGSLPTFAIAVALAGFCVLCVLARGRRRAEPRPAWACGQLVEPALSWTSAGFTKPLRLVLEGVLRPERELLIETDRGVVQAISYRGRVPHLIDERLYRPAVRLSLGAARHARRLQSGSLSSYVGYLVALLIVLLAAARIGLIG